MVKNTLKNNKKPVTTFNIDNNLNEWFDEHQTFIHLLFQILFILKKKLQKIYLIKKKFLLEVLK